MKSCISLLYRSLANGAIMVAFGLFAGCQPVAQESELQKWVFYPPPPEVPRLQFLTSISKAADLGIEESGAFETFIVGEPEEKIGNIIKPYGIEIFENQLYVCDVGARMVWVIDPVNHTFDTLTKDRRLKFPLNIFIDADGKKYVTDAKVGAVFVFDRKNQLHAILGKKLKIRPLDVVVRGQKCYITEFFSKQVLVLDKDTGKELTRLRAGENDGLFGLITGICMDRQGNIFVSDKLSGRISQFDSSGDFVKSFGQVSNNIHDFIRPKGIDVDQEGRIWIVDGSTEVAKIYDAEHNLLMYFGLPGVTPGSLSMPVDIVIDYDNVDLFKQYAVEGAELELLVLVTSQYGPAKVNIYGFGTFPEDLPSAMAPIDKSIKKGDDQEDLPETEITPLEKLGPEPIQEEQN